MEGGGDQKAEKTVVFDVIYLGRLGTGYKREVRRKIGFKESQTLVDLHEIIQEEMMWDDPHLYAFFMDGKAWSRNLDQEYLAPSMYRTLQGERAMLPGISCGIQP